MRALEYCERGFQSDGGRGFGIFKHVAESLERAAGQVADLVIQSDHVFAARMLDGSFEPRLVMKLIVNGRAMHGGLAGRGGDATPLREGGYNLGLGRRQVEM